MPTKINNVLSWAPDVDQKTLDQAEACAVMPFVNPHVALMPDAHFGYGSTVGSVIPTKGAIIPSAVGVDIGCGMIASRLNLTANQLPDNLNGLHAMISKAIPAGVGKSHEFGNDIQVAPALTFHNRYWTEKLVDTAKKQFGTLGAGNHFVEVCLDEDERVWIVLHSGSRGVGNQLANIHIDGAKALMKRYFIELDNPDLAYLVEGTTDFNHYIADMLWAQNYAMESRERMMRAALFCMETFLGMYPRVTTRINCHHNFTERENHMGQNLWITRKGAIRAREGDRGVIPGSMGAETFVVSGKGNVPSFMSCSHGAGRKMSRRAAERNLTSESLNRLMVNKAWNGDSVGLLDEHPDAYKDIHEVMANQTDLVTIDNVLTQILNYKGN